MAENLAWLPKVSSLSVHSLTEKLYYVYNYSGTDVSAAKATSNYSTYGVLYNWPAAMDGAAGSSANPSGVQGACPAGWHLPSDAEWTILTNYLIDKSYGFGGSGNDIAKSMAATENWRSHSTPGAVGDNPASNNSSGFSGLPGGCPQLDGDFYTMGFYGYWWSSTEYYTDSAWSRYLNYRYTYVNRYSDFDKDYGFSVRCLRDSD
jgi:uncharacterized protein (TIGR02145 family)